MPSLRIVAIRDSKAGLRRPHFQKNYLQGRGNNEAASACGRGRLCMTTSCMAACGHAMTTNASLETKRRWGVARSFGCAFHGKPNADYRQLHENLILYSPSQNQPIKQYGNSGSADAHLGRSRQKRKERWK